MGISYAEEREKKINKVKDVNKNFLLEAENVFNNYKKNEINKLSEEDKLKIYKNREKYKKNFQNTLTTLYMRSDLLDTLQYDVDFFKNSVDNLLSKRDPDQFLNGGWFR